jgi:hypothetical protein
MMTHKDVLTDHCQFYLPESFYCLDRVHAQPDKSLKPEKNPEKPNKNKKLVCYLCKNVITVESEHIKIQGSNEHLRTNPEGYQYLFACYADAPGCAIFGGPTREYSWFNGYYWQLAVCNGCGEHLGWLFKGPDRFFGLIKNRLISAQEF